MNYAQITRDLVDTGKRKNYLEPPPPPGSLHPDKPYWVPIVNETIDNSTGDQTLREGPEMVVEVDRLVVRFTIRDLTQAEIDAADAAAVEANFEQRGFFRALARVAFDQENRLRDLEGRPQVTPQQFKTALRGLVR